MGVICNLEGKKKKVPKEWALNPCYNMMDNIYAIIFF